MEKILKKKSGRKPKIKIINGRQPGKKKKKKGIHSNSKGWLDFHHWIQNGGQVFNLKFKRVVGCSPSDFVEGGQIFTLGFKRLVDFHLKLKLSIRGRFSPWIPKILEERFGFNSQVLKRGSRFLPSCQRRLLIGFSTKSWTLGNWAKGLVFYPRVKEGYYLVFSTKSWKKGLDLTLRVLKRWSRF